MGEQKKDNAKTFQLDKAAVQRLLDAAKILRAVTSQEDIERIKRKLGLLNNGSNNSGQRDDRITFDKRRVPPSPDVCHLKSSLQNSESGLS
jgi:hypothetical protein